MPPRCPDPPDLPGPMLGVVSAGLVAVARLREQRPARVEGAIAAHRQALVPIHSPRLPTAQLVSPRALRARGAARLGAGTTPTPTRGPTAPRCGRSLGGLARHHAGMTAT